MELKNESKSEIIKESRSKKNEITSAITKAPIHVASRMPAHVLQPRTVCSFLCRLPLNMRKKMKRVETDAYRILGKMVASKTKIKVKIA